ncbi:sigma-70 family RNA polymerase sigma factor [Nocardia jiangxiensis]|uniref:sigma-70 family RNA polymerase sigma factor n=1 Tax=Nocardia jiangxiensis TaxID=282685 RepID=UPI0002F9F375|nr:sigma-70 family RNA polymerase sigma factor [Nocardia jiangxiensis]
MDTSDRGALPDGRGSSGLDPLDPVVPDPVAQALDALDRAAADRELFELAAEHDAGGPAWEELVAALSAYAWNVLDPWICCGEIYTRVSGKLAGLDLRAMAHQRLSTDAFCREEVIAHTITRAVEKLRNAIRTGSGWDPRKGLALRSYFITGCLNEFVYVVRRENQWWTSHRREPTGPDEPTEAAGLLSGSRLNIDPAEIVTTRLVVFQYLAGLSAEDRKVLWAHAIGYSHAEIAHLFRNLTPKAIERRLHKIRKHARLSVRNR